MILVSFIFDVPDIFPFNLQAMHNIDPLMSEFKDTMEKTDALMSKLAELCQVESSNVRKTNFYRAKHALTHAEKKKTQLQQLIRRFTEMVRIIYYSKIHSFF